MASESFRMALSMVNPAAHAICRCSAASVTRSLLLEECFEALFSVVLALLTQHAEQMRLCVASITPGLRYMLLTVMGLDPDSLHYADEKPAAARRRVVMLRRKRKQMMMKAGTVAGVATAAGTRAGVVVVPLGARVGYAERLARIYEALVSMATAFRKHVVYVLADHFLAAEAPLVQQRQRGHVELVAWLNQGRYLLLDACTSHQLQQLHAILPAPARMRLKALHADYLILHKYTGE